jgi:hypothetical protein
MVAAYATIQAQGECRFAAAACPAIQTQTAGSQARCGGHPKWVKQAFFNEKNFNLQTHALMA